MVVPNLKPTSRDLPVLLPEETCTVARSNGSLGCSPRRACLHARRSLRRDPPHTAHPQSAARTTPRHAQTQRAPRRRAQDAGRSVVKDADHHFTIRACDWGFREFVALSELRDASSGFVVDDKLVISARVRVEPQVNWWNWDSKKETGHVGLKNQVHARTNPSAAAAPSWFSPHTH